MQRNHRGFTLVELLVVIAIISVLAAILFPVFSMVRAKARIANDTSNLQQIGVNLAQYLLDNNGEAPPFLYGPLPSGAGNYCPINQAGLFVAPADRAAKDVAANRKFSYQDDGYGNVLYNYWGLSAQGYGWSDIPSTPAYPAAPGDYFPALSTGTWPAPSQAAWQDAGVKKLTDFPMMRNRKHPPFTIVTWSPYNRDDLGDGGSPYDDGPVIVLFADGHAKYYSKAGAEHWLAPEASYGNLTPFQYQASR
jgi:prepilin-type N-terminal cleavage/methylation domain-containing protein/prepilin-type processing-associated H-X9-DG protein